MNISVYTVKLEKHDTILSRQPITATGNPHNFIKFLRRYFSGVDREHHVVVLLDCLHQVIGIHTAGIGTLTSVQYHQREILKAAILGNAYAIILAHNHPSGDSTPSDADRITYKTMKEAAMVMGMFLMDDIVLGENSYFSFQEEADRQTTKDLKKQREQAVAKSRRRIEQGQNCHRDVVLMAAATLEKIPGMLKAESAAALNKIIDDLQPIVTTSDRIRRATRTRADEILKVAVKMQSSGNYFDLSGIAAATEWEEEKKSYNIPLVDFIELPTRKRSER